MNADPIAAIKAKLSIEEVVSAYVPLKRVGKYYKALCPFHQEKTPSFYVHPDRQMAYCFGCNKGGDIFEFLQTIEGLSFKEALEQLAERAHVELPKQDFSKPRVSRDEKERLRNINLDAERFYVKQLLETPDGAKVLSYMKGRGLSEVTLKEFKVGFAPEGSDTLYRYLLEQGHHKEDLLKSTVVLSKDASAKHIFDRFHLRLIFPIHDEQGHTTAFGGRVLRKGDEPKYLNSPEYELYTKSHVLYNFHRAKKAIREHDFAIVVEGYMDVLMASQAGTHNVVAPCGTAVTQEQLLLLRRASHKIAFALDQDSAGQEALLRGVKLAQNLDLDIYVIPIPSGKDPADTVKEDPNLWAASVSAKKPYLEYFLELWSAQMDLDNTEAKRELTDRILDLVKETRHPVERDQALKALSQKVDSSVEHLYDYLKSLQKPEKVRSLRQEKGELHSNSKFERLYDYFLSLLLAFPEIFAGHRDEFLSFEYLKLAAEQLGLIKPVSKIQMEEFERFLVRLADHPVYKAVITYYNQQAQLDEDFFASFEDGFHLKKKALEAEIQHSNPEEVKQEFEKLLVLLCCESLKS